MPAERAAIAAGARDHSSEVGGGLRSRDCTAGRGCLVDVRLMLQRAAAAGLGWPLPAALTDTALEARLFTTVGTKQRHRRQAEPDWPRIHRELKRKHVRLAILWDEYIEEQP